MGAHSDPFPAGSQAAAALATSENPLYVSFALASGTQTKTLVSKNTGQGPHTAPDLP